MTYVVSGIRLAQMLDAGSRQFDGLPFVIAKMQGLYNTSPDEVNPGFLGITLADSIKKICDRDRERMHVENGKVVLDEPMEQLKSRTRSLIEWLDLDSRYKDAVLTAYDNAWEYL